MTIIEVVTLPRALHDTAEVLLIFAVLGLVLIALADMQALIKGRRRR